MKFIEIQAHDKTYFINPDQITHVEGSESGPPENIYIGIKLTEIKDGESVALVFRGDDASHVFQQLRMVGVI